MRYYVNFTDAELVSEFDSRRQHSQVIDELCRRLEQVAAMPTDSSIECPICDATINVDVTRHREHLIIGVVSP